MGSCFSAAATTAVTQPQSAAKVITPSGDLLEFTSPIKSSLVLDSSSFFICNSDCLSYNERAPALGPDELILPDQLYFILPLQKLYFALTGDDMAALAVKAISALMVTKKGCGRCDVKKAKFMPMSVADGGVGSEEHLCPGFRVSPQTWGVQEKMKVMKRNRSMRRPRVAPMMNRSQLDTIEEVAL